MVGWVMTAAISVSMATKTLQEALTVSVTRAGLVLDVMWSVHSMENLSTGPAYVTRHGGETCVMCPGVQVCISVIGFHCDCYNCSNCHCAA